MKFSIRIDDLEVRSCDDSLLVSYGSHTTAELIKWENGLCFSLAYWVGGDLKFVGERPFSEDSYKFWKLAQIGQKVLEELKELEANNAENSHCPSIYKV